MPLLNKDKFPPLVPVMLIVALLSVGFTTCKHLLFSGNSQWITADHETRRVGYHTERLNLRTAVNSDDDAAPSDFPQQVFNLPVAQSTPFSSFLVFSVLQWHGEIKNYLRDQSPVLNL